MAKKTTSACALVAAAGAMLPLPIYLSGTEAPDPTDA